MRKILKKIYELLPLKKQIFLVLRLLPIPESIFKHLYFNGLISVEVGNKSFKMFHYGYQLENELFWRGLKGGWEKTSMQIWTSLSKHSAVIFDIGANTGVFSLVSETINPNSKIFAFEPVQRVYEKLEKNIEMNKHHITPVCKGLSDFDGVATIYDLPTEHIYSVTINENTNPPERNAIPTQVAVITVDSFCEKNNLNQIDLLKIDVETHEPEVLLGALKTLKKNCPPMIIEILNETVAQRVHKILEGFNYLFFSLDETKGAIHCKKLGEMGFGNYLACKKTGADFLKLAV
ncbi:MAG: FkbM family methyltransferase [Bacteroidetes bacterium]|nr:FkbM family methyltransferase [Bacteroidota bacterium]